METNKTMLVLQRLLLTAFATLLLWGISSAQLSRISGTVKGAQDLPLQGASVNVKGTSATVTTNESGEFAIDAKSGDILVISFVGYQTQEVTVTGTAAMNVVMAQSVGQMEDVVVIGYGVQKKALTTGANLQVKADAIQKQNSTGALQALQGQAPGVQITNTSGQPGSGLSVVIRGKGTIGNASPLYIVDGVYTNDISYLNPADIQTIDVLKDAASAAIYGSQGANGVILVTTKTGRSNMPTQVTLDAFYGLQNVPRKAQLLNAREYGIIMNEAAINSGKTPYFSNDELNNLPVNTNWMDEMFVSNAITQNYVVGLQGGGGSSTFSTGFSYTGQEGIVGGKALSNYERYVFRVNSEHGLFGKIAKIGEHLTYNYTKNNGIGVGNQYNNTLRAAFNTSPFVPMYDADGNFFNNSNSDWNPGESNPFAVMSLTNQNRNASQRLFGDVYLQIEPVKGLRLRSSLGINMYNSDGHSFTPIYQLSIYSFSDNTWASQSMGKSQSWQWDNTLSYAFSVAGDHDFEVMAGTMAQRANGSSMYGRNRDLIFEDLEHAWLNNATNTVGTLISLDGSPWEDALQSYFGRVQYNYREKYLFNATLRADGSSKFAAGNRWGYFPSLSAGWVISKEDFMDNSRLFDFLKLRASWGRVGNQNIAGFQFLTPISFNNANYSFGNGEGNLTPGAFPSRLGNPDVTWETSQQTNIGLDAVMGNFSLNADFYIKDTKDWLIQAPVLATAGADAPFINGGDVRNSGVELALNYKNNTGDFHYSIGVNGAYNKNRIGNIPTQDHIIHGNTNSLFDNSLEFYRAQNGYPVGYFWGLKTDGIFQTEGDVLAHNKGGSPIQPNAQPGDIRYVDLNGDGVISDLDRSMIGDPNPDITYGINLGAEFRGFDFSLLAYGVSGNQLVQSWRNQANTKANYSAAILERWHGANSSNSMPRVTEDNRNWTQFSQLYIHDGDFLRINNVTLGYDFGKLINKGFISKARLYASVLNLYTFTNYNGMDPEVGYGEGFSAGVDLGYYPRPRTFMLGANIRF